MILFAVHCGTVTTAFLAMMSQGDNQVLVASLAVHHQICLFSRCVMPQIAVTSWVSCSVMARFPQMGHLRVGQEAVERRASKENIHACTSMTTHQCAYGRLLGQEHIKLLLPHFAMLPEQDHPAAASQSELFWRDA